MAESVCVFACVCVRVCVCVCVCHIQIDSVDQFDNQIRTKLPELDTALKVAETRVNELERKANNADRMTRVRACVCVCVCVCV